MFRRFFILVAALAISTSVLSAKSNPGDIIPKPVEYTLAEGVYSLKGDDSDIKVVLNSSAFAQKVKDLPEFAQEEAYELTVSISCRFSITSNGAPERTA